MALPPGFELETPAAAPAMRLPPGFELEAPVSPSGRTVTPPPEVPIGRRVMQFVRPTVEALGGVGGAAVGTALGPFGTVGGAGLGYGIAKTGMDVLEQALGYQRAPSSASEALAAGAKDVLTGATYETAGRVAGPLVGRAIEEYAKPAVSKVLNVKGRQATKLARAAAGDQIDAIRAALRGAQPGETPAQATADISRKAWQTLNALGNSSDARDVILKNQVDDLTAELSRIARGGNETEIRNALAESRRVLNQLTTPMREAELAAANQAGQTIAALAPRAAQKQASMVSALQQSGKLSTDAAQRAEAAAQQLQRVEPGRIPAVSATQAAQAQAASARQFDEAAQVFGEIATQRRAERDFIQRQIGSLEDYGLRPLNIDNVTSAIESAMTAPGRRVSAQQQQVLGKVRDQLRAAAAINNGVIDARDLYTIRKEGVNEIIEDLMKGRDPKVSKKVAADVLSIVRPEIDRAIETAGGAGWKSYLETFEQGAKELEKRQLAAEAVRLFKDSPQEYIKLVRGNNTAAVESIFGTGNFDIFKEMAKEMPTLEKAASYIQREGRIAEAAAGGAEELARIVEKNTWKRHLPNWLNPKVALANVAIKDIQKKLNESTLNAIREASASNKSMLELLEGLPLSERNKLLRLLTATETWAKAPAGRAAATVTLSPENDNKLSSQSTNMLAPRVELRGMATR